VRHDAAAACFAGAEAVGPEAAEEKAAERSETRKSEPLSNLPQRTQRKAGEEVKGVGGTIVTLLSSASSAVIDVSSFNFEP
jgi:hypothetical protein